MAVEFYKNMMDILDVLSDKVEERGALFHLLDEGIDTDLYERAFMLRKAFRDGTVKIPLVSTCPKGHEFAHILSSPGNGVFPDCPTCTHEEAIELRKEVQELRSKHYG